ncbi:MAG: FAD:protein FMN transferase [Candidatus Margulisbacteria bacterium]|nr:FAD:protein FMN transferase [Candidatus Margulisiibacteriota bacterium]
MLNKKPISLILYSIIAILIFLSLVNSVFGLKTYSQQKYILHTQTEILVLARSKQKADKAIKKAYERIEEIEKIVNFFDPQSELSKINEKAAYQEVQLSNEMYFLLKKAFWGSEITKGAFDITTTPLSQLYGFGSETKQIPSKKQVKAALSLVGYENIILNEKNKTIRLAKKGIKLDLGGMAKGYTIDEGIKVLKAEGIKSGFINAGGNIFALGRTKNFTPWKIGIRHPRQTNKVIGTIKLNNSAVATSGDYEQFFIQGHKRYHHIMNPRTGKSATGMISATIICPDALTSDILSTGIFVLGPEKGTEVVKNLGYKAILIFEKDNKLEIKNI